MKNLKNAASVNEPSQSVKNLAAAVAAAGAAPVAEKKQKLGLTGRPFYKIIYDPRNGQRTQEWAGEKVAEFKTPGGVEMVEVRLERLDTHAVSYYKCNKANLVLIPIYE